MVKDNSSSKIQILRNMWEKRAAAANESANVWPLPFVKEEYLYLKSGIEPDFIPNWLSLASDMIFSARSKLTENDNPRHDRSSPKTTKHHIKTALSASALSGHLPIGKDYKIVKKEIIKNEVYAVTYKQKDGAEVEDYLTFERQNLGFIETQINSGYYKIDTSNSKVTRDKHNNISDVQLVIEDKLGDKFVIHINEKTLRSSTGQITSVAKLAAALETKKSFIVHDSTSEINAAFVSDLFAMNTDKTAPLYRWDDAKKDIDPNPYIVCDQNGVPIKGDVDIQNSILPDYLPVYALQFINLDIKNKNDPNLIKALIKKLQTLYDELNKHEIAYAYLGLIQKAITRLQGHDKTKFADIISKNAIILERGNTTLIGLVLSLVTSVVMHGNDAGSPLYPENIVVTQIPEPGDAHRCFNTYGEFDYVKTLLANDKLTDNKIIDFNPCWLVEDNVGVDGKSAWRKDETKNTKDSDGMPRTYNNYADQKYSVALWNLLLEKQLLQYKIKYPDRFEDLTKVMLNNYKHMLQNAEEVLKLRKIEFSRNEIMLRKPGNETALEEFNKKISAAKGLVEITSKGIAQVEKKITAVRASKNAAGDVEKIQAKFVLPEKIKDKLSKNSNLEQKAKLLDLWNTMIQQQLNIVEKPGYKKN